MRKIHLLVAASFLYVASAQCQFQYSYGLPNHAENGKSIIKDRDKNVLIAGNVEQGPFGKSDASIMKLDANGNQIWALAYGKSGYDYFETIREVPKNEFGVRYVAAGRSDSYGNGAFDAYLVGIDEHGNELFSGIYGSQHYDNVNCIQVVKTGLSPYDIGILMVGTVKGYSYKLDAYVALTDLQGNLLKGQYITESGNLEGHWIEQVDGGDFVLTGYAQHNFGMKMVYAARLDNSLNLMWKYRMYIPPFKNAEGYSIKEDPDNNLVIAGYIDQGFDEDAFLLKLDKGGNFIDMRTFNYGLKDRGHSLLVDVDEFGLYYYVVLGRTDKIFGVSGEKDALLFKTKKDFDVMWARRHGLNDDEQAYEICFGVEKGYYYTGYTNSIGFGSNDFYFVQTDMYGNTKTKCDFEIILKEDKKEVDMADYGKIYPAPFYELFNSIYEKLDLMEDRCEEGKESLNSNEINMIDVDQLQIFPVPASNQITINFPTVYVNGNVQIIDITGKQLLDSRLGSQQTDISIQEIPQGIYLLRIQKDGNSMTKRFVKE